MNGLLQTNLSSIRDRSRHEYQHTSMTSPLHCSSHPTLTAVSSSSRSSAKLPFCLQSHWRGLQAGHPLQTHESTSSSCHTNHRLPIRSAAASPATVTRCCVRGTGATSSGERWGAVTTPLCCRYAWPTDSPHQMVHCRTMVTRKPMCSQTCGQWHKASQLLTASGQRMGTGRILQPFWLRQALECETVVSS